MSIVFKKPGYLTTVLAVAVLGVLAVGGYIINVNQNNQKTSPDDTATATFGWGDAQVTKNEPQSSATNVRSQTNSESGSQKQSATGDITGVDFSNPKMFTHESRNFSFEYPQNLRIGRFGQGDTEIIVVQNPDEQIGFQISIRSIDERVAMTKERIQEDLPDLEVRQPRPVQLGADAGQGLAFYSDNEAFGGNSREVWFTFNNHLYQISTYANLDPLLKQVLNSWTFG
jgi:hypothetical protein